MNDKKTREDELLEMEFERATMKDFSEMKEMYLSACDDVAAVEAEIEQVKRNIGNLIGTEL